ncbi:MAG: hypothetical protein AMJ79_16020 [Phycisphaerae bacterium SM23_30]|nr:MAG: hypothetical protein AMJ79_16020 [Phycisphaerae bacterium SM23_30]
MPGKKELSLLKGNQKFLFRYEPGSEEAVLDAFVDMAHDRNQDFDWFDAAVLSFQLSKNLVEEADELLGIKSSSAADTPVEPPPHWP